MRFVLVSKETGSTISEDFANNIYIGMNGKIYEIYAASADGEAWLDHEDVTSKYFVRLSDVELELELD